MNDVDVLLDLFERQISWFKRDLPNISEELWLWRPDPEANNIFLTMWHLSRIMDWLVTRMLDGSSAAEEFWHTEGWARKTGYDPTGLGWEQAGILSGYTQEEAHQIPIMSTADILIYLDYSYVALQQRLKALPPNGMAQLAPGLGGERSIYFWCQLSLVDLMQHWGEILAIQAMWERGFLRA